MPTSASHLVLKSCPRGSEEADLKRCMTLVRHIPSHTNTSIPSEIELNLLLFSLPSVFIADAESLIRTIPGEDRTNGFFVAMFVRSGPVSLDNSSLKRKLDGGEVGEPANRKKRKKKRKKKSMVAGTTIDEESDVDVQ
jgi:hypothetical protein